MKKVTLTTFFALMFLCLGFAPLYAHQPAGQQQGMMNQQSGAVSNPQMTPAQAQKLQAAMKKMQAVREKMLAAKTPEERFKLMREHMKDMQACMNLMFAGNAMKQPTGKQGQMGPQHMMGGQGRGMMMPNGNRMMGNRGYQGMMSSWSCGPMMQQMMRSFLAQMNMMMNMMQSK